MPGPPEDRPAFFTAPFIHCSKCRRLIPLPYGPLPRTDLVELIRTKVEDRISLPAGEWTAIFGCPRCGRVSSYSRTDIRPYSHPPGKARGYHDSATLFAATFPCANMRCKVPATVYANIETGGASEYLRLLRLGSFQGKLPCGHDIGSVPESRYTIERVTERLW